MIATARGAAAALVGVVASLACAVPAGAFTPPELFVRLQRADITHEPASDWIPLASAPSLSYLGGYQIGYRLQSSGVANELQRAALAVASVPDGMPTQPRNTPPYCVALTGTAGTIVAVGSEVQFEGDGTYTVAVSVGAASGGPSDCLAGPTSAASFSVDVHVVPELVGAPLAFRARPLPDAPFVGLRVAQPPGGSSETRCALDATVQPDGSVAGRLIAPKDGPSPVSMIAEGLFPRPGAWTCVARGTGEGVDDAFETTSFPTPWSAPLPVEVRSDFRRVKGRIVRPRSAHPLLTFTAEFPEVTPGAKATLKLRRALRCRGSRYVLKTVGTFRSSFDAKGRASIRIRRPRKVGYYLGTLSISGTRFYRASADPKAVLLDVVPKSGIGFTKPAAFPRCPGFV
jgi:hypothetical protein